MGYAALRFACSTCVPRETVGATASVLRIGWTLDPRWLVGLEWAGWRREGSDDAGGNVMAAVTWYPRARGHAFLRSGVGRATFHGTQFDGPREQGQGLGFLMGAGFDLRMSPRVSVTPLVTVTHGRVGTTTVLGQVVRSGVRYTALAVGIGITVH